MGNNRSINNQPIGKSIMYKKFFTNTPTCLGYSTYDNQYDIEPWDSKITIINPKSGSFIMKINEPIYFMITGIENKSDIVNGSNIRIQIQILNNINIKYIDTIQEADSQYNWYYTNINKINNPFFPKIINGYLVTQNLIVMLYHWHYDIEIPHKKPTKNGHFNQIDYTQPIYINSNKLVEFI